MSNDNIDASVGLTFSLKVFAAYRQSGLLSASVGRVPGIRGKCKAYLELDKGQIVSCYLEDQQRQRIPLSRGELLRLDEERGPFEWSMQPLSTPLTVSPPPPQPTNQKKSYILRRLVSQIPQYQLQRYTPWQRHLLLTVFSLVNGERTLEEIGREAQLPSLKVEETLRVLIALKLVTIN